MAKRMRTHEEVDETDIDRDDEEREGIGRFMDDDDDEMTAENPDDEDVDSAATRGTTPKKK